MLLAMLIIFLCFVILDPWKVLKPESPAPTPGKGQGRAPAPGRPDFSEIKIRNRLRPIHHAVVREIRNDGLIFLADEGLIKASFKDLEPEFTKYYLYIATLRKEKSAGASALLTGEPPSAVPDPHHAPAGLATSAVPRS